MWTRASDVGGAPAVPRRLRLLLCRWLIALARVVAGAAAVPAAPRSAPRPKRSGARRVRVRVAKHYPLATIVPVMLLNDETSDVTMAPLNDLLA